MATFGATDTIEAVCEYPTAEISPELSLHVWGVLGSSMGLRLGQEGFEMFGDELV